VVIVASLVKLALFAPVELVLSLAPKVKATAQVLVSISKIIALTVVRVETLAYPVKFEIKPLVKYLVRQAKLIALILA